PNYRALQDNLRRLRGKRQENGNMLRVVELPMPGPVEYQGQRLPASYANFYIANDLVLVPTYRDPNDAEALSILRRLFPRRRVIGIDSTDLIWGLGSFHCISQQEPA
ncbi:MAG TPA: agmatine deiminase family protein, partial [Verrucomicrobiae bacterium]|nr:agmatine deiminase family protein [Verrucomicrobiae bacterium]